MIRTWVNTTEYHSVCVQGHAQAAAEGKGKSRVPGVTYEASRSKRWIVNTQKSLGNCFLTSAGSQEEAEAISATCIPRLEVAADEGRLEGELAALKAMFKAAVRRAFPNCILDYRMSVRSIRQIYVNHRRQGSFLPMRLSIHHAICLLFGSTCKVVHSGDSPLTTHVTWPGMLNSYMDVTPC